jgi:hypothetical protein
MKSLAAAMMMAGVVVLGAASPAFAMPESCQKDLNTYAEKRMAAINRINAFKGKRPTASAACSAFGNLVASEDKMIKWMEGNKEWCQIPDTLIDDLKKNSAQGIKVRGQACSAAKKEAQMRAQAARQQTGGGAPRPAVRLPQGAL